MTSVLNEESVEKKLRTVSCSQDSIQTLSLWIIHHKNHHAKIVELWMKVLKKTTQPSHRLTLFYLCNDVIQNCKKKKAFVYNTTFKEYLREAAGLVRDQTVKNKVERVFQIWGERGVYDAAFIKSLHSILNGQHVKSYKVHESVKEEKSSTHVRKVKTPKADYEPKEAPVEHQAEKDDEESARILAEFKPHEMVDQIAAFLRQDADLRFRSSQLTHLRFDAASVESVRHLKDRAVGNNFNNHFEDSCMKLEDVIKRLTRHIHDQRALLATLGLSETFYEEQYREAKIVANAYRNFGARINNMKKKLDELKKSMMELDSPIPSPDINAPSPVSTPPPPSMPDYTYNPAAPMNYGQASQMAPWMYSDTRSMSVTSVGSIPQDSNSLPGSPPLEAPSPDGSPPDLNLDGSENAIGSLDSRLARFFGGSHAEPSVPAVYTPQLPVSVITNSRSEDCAEDEGSTTPIDDETPTTPVLDEHLASPPKRSPPPKKENPIDFLSRLISQTQKAPVKTGTQSFLDSLTMLTMPQKKPDSASQHQLAATTATQSWTVWNSASDESNTLPSQPSSPTTYGPSVSTPTSPQQYPSVLTMVPPPIPVPVPPPGLGVPPPALLGLNAPASLGLGVPSPSPLGLSVPPTAPLGLSMPPPPPPFILTQALTQTFSSSSFSFQKTSSEQSESRLDEQLDQAINHVTSARTSHGSLLKELVPADSLIAKTEPHRAEMETESDEIITALKTEAEMPAEGKTEHSQKLKQKISHGTLKSHVFVPNPERPNLMTLTVSDDLNEEDMIDEDTVMEEASEWVSKNETSRSRSQSLSLSREKDIEEWEHDGEDGCKSPETDKTNVQTADGDVQNTEIRTARRDEVEKRDEVTRRDEVETRDERTRHDEVEKRDERVDRNHDYWRNLDRKYNHHNNRGLGWRGAPYRPYRFNRGSSDSVRAYSQGHKEPFFQPYNRAPFNPFLSGPPPIRPRMPNYGRY